MKNLSFEDGRFEVAELGLRAAELRRWTGVEQAADARYAELLAHGWSEDYPARLLCRKHSVKLVDGAHRLSAAPEDSVVPVRLLFPQNFRRTL